LTLSDSQVRLLDGTPFSVHVRCPFRLITLGGFCGTSLVRYFWLSRIGHSFVAALLAVGPRDVQLSPCPGSFTQILSFPPILCALWVGSDLARSAPDRVQGSFFRPFESNFLDQAKVFWVLFRLIGCGSSLIQNSKPAIWPTMLFTVPPPPPFFIVLRNGLPSFS